MRERGSFSIPQECGVCVGARARVGSWKEGIFFVQGGRDGELGGFFGKNIVQGGGGGFLVRQFLVYDNEHLLWRRVRRDVKCLFLASMYKYANAGKKFSNELNIA